MSKKYWFKPKIYGYGLSPISIEGWVATLALIGMIIFSGFLNDIFSVLKYTLNSKLRFVFDIIVLLILFFSFTKDKTDD